MKSQFNIFFFIIVIISSCNLQTHKQQELLLQLNDTILFQDGIKSTKIAFINSCLESTKLNGMNNFMNIEGYCNCLIESIALNYTFAEIRPILKKFETPGLDHYKNYKEFLELPGMKQIVNDCTKTNLISNSNKNFIINSEEEKLALIKYLKEVLMKQKGYYEFEKLINVDGYCECLTVGLFKQMSYKEIIMNTNLENDPTLQKLQDSCLLKHRK